MSLTDEPSSSPKLVDPADVSAVIVNWNTADLLDACLRSLASYSAASNSVAGHPTASRGMHVVVVDNGSEDDSLEMLAQRWPEVEVIANRENVGFCRANNQAIARCSSPWLLLINADAELTDGCLDALLRRGTDDPRAAVIGPRLVYGDGRFQRWTAGAEPTLRSVGAYLFGLDRLARWVPGVDGVYLGQDTTQAFQPGWVSSACMLVRRAALDQVGVLDERIFVYMDDVDLCRRARDGGWHVWYEPAGTAIHLMGQSTKRRTGRASPEALRAFNRYFAARHGQRQLRALRAMQVAGFGLRAGAYGAASITRRGRHHRASASAHLTHLRLALEYVEDRS